MTKAHPSLITGVPEKNRSGIPRGPAFPDALHNLVQAYGFVPDNLRTDIDTAINEINEREVPEVVIMVMTVDNPAIKRGGCLSRVVNKEEFHVFILSLDRRNRTGPGIVMITADKDNLPPEPFTVLHGRFGIRPVPQVAKTIDPGLWTDRIIPVFYEYMIHFPAVGEKERARAIADDIGMTKMQVCNQEYFIRIYGFWVLVLKTGAVTVLDESPLPPCRTVAVVTEYPPFLYEVVFRKDGHILHDGDPDSCFIEQDRSNDAAFFTQRTLRVTR
jgi:hypothetical protein